MHRAAIEALLHQRSTAIPPALRADFLAYQWVHARYSTLLLASFALPMLVLYAAVDAYILPDIVLPSLLARIGLCVCVVPVLYWLFRHTRQIQWIDLTLLLLVLACCIVWFALLMYSALPVPTGYLYASLIFLVTSCLCVQSRFTFAVLGSAAIGAVSIYGAWHFAQPGGSLQPLVVFLATYVPVWAFALFFCWKNLLASRRAFLHAQLSHMESSTLRSSHAQMRSQLDTDALTGVGNRRAFDQHIPRLWQACSAGGHFALLIADIDHFKHYNDHYGHPEGDKCLSAVAHALANCVRTHESLLIRYGGEEFVMLIRVPDAHAMHQVADRMVQAARHLALEHLARPDGLRIVTVSVGACHCSEVVHGDTDVLLRTADSLLYTAKQEGRNQWRSSFVPHKVPR